MNTESHMIMPIVAKMTKSVTTYAISILEELPSEELEAIPTFFQLDIFHNFCLGVDAYTNDENNKCHVRDCNVEYEIMHRLRTVKV